MQLHQLQSKTPRKSQKRVGRGGKRGTFSGHGTKGQKSRAGSSVKPGFRGGDNRIWQMFPKLRGASKKPGNASPHPKHRFYQLRHDKPTVVNLNSLNSLDDGQTVSPELLLEKGFIDSVKNGVKILGEGELKKKLNFNSVKFSVSAKEKIIKAGGEIESR